MKKNSKLQPAVFLILLAQAALNTRAGGPGHEDDLIIGRSAAGQLKVESAAFNEHLALPPVSGLLNGFSLDEPGTMSLAADEPDEDFFQLAPGANIRFEVVAISPALKAHTPGFFDTLDVAGETWDLGQPPIHEHPTWHIDSDDGSYVASQLQWAITFRVVDLGPTAYSPSDDYTVVFTNVDATLPAASGPGLVLMCAFVLAGGSIAFARSRQSRIGRMNT